MSYPQPSLDLNKMMPNQVHLHRGEAPAVATQPFRLVTACSYCDQIRIVDDRLEPKWISREAYDNGSLHYHDQLTHGICPNCYENIVQPVLLRLRRNATI